jgi:hypothetical protein
MYLNKMLYIEKLLSEKRKDVTFKILRRLSKTSQFLDELKEVATVKRSAKNTTIVQM